MQETEKQAARKTPKGGRRGGTVFPKINLKQALAYAKKLVAKTHTRPQAEEAILAGVFSSAGPTGKVRASALKQYGLLEGEGDEYKATKLARDIDAALEGEAPALLQQAFLNPKVFRGIFETYKSDTVSKGKIEQRAKALKVHPESAAECAQLFMESAVAASLGTLVGDSSISLAKTASPSAHTDPTDADIVTEEEPVIPLKDSFISDTSLRENTPAQKDTGETTPDHAKKERTGAVSVTLNVDSTSDPDKLEKQLKLLREYGVI